METFIKVINELKPGPAALFGSIISAFIATFTVLSARQIEYYKRKRENYDTIKKYANPIIQASETLAFRLQEIISHNAFYLLPNAPKNEFFEYKFNSTVYRLCALLGWIQAAKKEQSYLSVKSINQHKKVQDAISKFISKLADGAHVELSILTYLGNLFNIPITNLTDSEKALLAVEMENLIFDKLQTSTKTAVLKLTLENQVELIEKIMELICRRVNHSIVRKEVIQERIESAKTEIARTYYWIYRDWQSAIGEEMILKVDGVGRRFDILGFAEFQIKHTDSFWLKRVDNLFIDIDMGIEDRFDSRGRQIKELFSALVSLIECLKELVKSQETITDKNLSKLKKFNEELTLKLNTNK